MKIRLWHLVVGFIIGIAACLITQRVSVASRESGCDVYTRTEVAPSGGFRATLTNKTCNWGLGLAANFSSVKLEKLGANGWFQNIDLETDQPFSERPTMAWTASNDLEILVKSDRILGSVQLTQDGLRFTRKYVTAK